MYKNKLYIRRLYINVYSKKLKSYLLNVFRDQLYIHNMEKVIIKIIQIWIKLLVDIITYTNYNDKDN
jgi:hypothetical protein